MQKKQNKKNETPAIETSIETSIETAIESIETTTEVFEIVPPIAERLMDADPLMLLVAAKNRMNIVLNHCQTKLAAINAAINVHTVFVQSKQDKINEERIQQVISVNQSIGNILTVDQVKAMLGIKPIAAQTTARTSESAMDINALVIQYHCSFGKLPMAIKATMTKAHKARYTQLQGYYNSIITKGLTGDSYYSNLIKYNVFNSDTMTSHDQLPLNIHDTNGHIVTYDKYNEVTQKVEPVPYCKPESSSTTSRFFESYKLYQSTL